MKKLQIFMLCSVLAVGFADSLQASWFAGKPKETPREAPKSDVKPTEAPISSRDAAMRKTSAKDAAIKSGQRVADVVPADALTTQSNELAEQSKSIFGKRSIDGQNAASKPQGIARNTAVENTSNAVVKDAINATGQPVSAEAERVITAEAVKSAKTWSDTWNESSFKQWIDSIVESVNRYISKFSGKAPTSTGINLGDGSTSDSQQNSTTGSFKLNAFADVSGISSTKSSPLITDAQSNLNTAQVNSDKSVALNENASEFKKSTSALLEQTKAQQSGLTFWNGYGLFQ